MQAMIGPKQHRQQQLVEILNRESLSSQVEVVRQMRSKGFDVTQPSISRDFRELGVVKLSGRYVVDAASGRGEVAQEKGIPNADDLVLGIQEAGPNLLVVRTREGAANVVAAAIDRQAHESIVGTIAGDDTIFVATASGDTQPAVSDFIKGLC